MYQITPYTPSYTIFYRDGDRVVYNNIVDLIEDIGDFCGRRKRWLRGLKYEVAKGFNPYCVRCCQPLTNSTLGSKCYTYTYHYDSVKQKMRRIQHEHPEHDVRYCIIVRDDFGKAYDARELLDHYEQQRPRRSFNSQQWERWDANSDIRERNIRARHGHNDIGCYRAIRTINERRQYDAAMVEDDQPHIRGRRSKNNIPNAWDDFRVSLYDTAKSWKTQRVRKQWMINLND